MAKVAIDSMSLDRIAIFVHEHGTFHFNAVNVFVMKNQNFLISTKYFLSFLAHLLRIIHVYNHNYMFNFRLRKMVELSAKIPGMTNGVDVIAS